MKKNLLFLPLFIVFGATSSIKDAVGEVAQISPNKVGLFNAHHGDSHAPTAHEQPQPKSGNVVGFRGKVLGTSAPYPGVFSSAVHEDWKERLQEDETIQRVIGYLGRTSINLFSDLEDSLEFGNSDEWGLARGETVNGSQTCRDGGGYDISVTRVDFTRLEGQVTAENCEFSGLKVSGTVSFTYEDDNYYQATPLQLYPLKFEFSGASITDSKGRKVDYSGDALCDWRFNSNARSVTYEIQSPSSRYHFGEQYDGDLIYVSESGSIYQSDDPSWINNGLEFNQNGGTGTY